MRALRELERLRMEFGGAATAHKCACLDELERARLASPAAVRRLHEALCFLRAYPDDAALLARVERQLAGFARRPDLRRHAEALADSGIAGTPIRYPFFAATAAWLAARHPRELHVDWDMLEDEQEQRLLDRLDPLLAFCEGAGLDELDLALRQWLARLKGPAEADGAFLARRFAALPADGFLSEGYYDELGLALELRPGARTPSRTRAKLALDGVPFAYQRTPLRHARPELATVLKRTPRVRALSATEGARCIELAREALVTRSRDLDVFAYGDPHDVRLLECEDGLAFAAIGFRPERRLLLEAVYGFLTLVNGVPIGYVLNSALFGSAEIAFNVFETYRGAEAAHVYGWVLSCVRHLFDVNTFTIYPYQLGQHNEEGLASGAWWFYQRFGFRPRAPSAVATMQRELARMRREPKQRSNRATLMRLADHNMYLSVERERRDVIGELALGRVGLAASALLARRFGAERERGERVLAQEAARRFGVRSFAGWARGERL
ncbi:MAG: hypothetical protein EXS08_10155, partial [Planctomycetes bacterium]|nr:hypothetical protein [Planctomycetota bacterium]